MKYIYIENYIQLSQKQKISFFNFLLASNEFKILHQEIIFEEESIMLKLDNKIDITNSKEAIEEYFKINNVENINIEIVKKHNTKSNKTILTFIKTNKHILI